MSDRHRPQTPESGKERTMSKAKKIVTPVETPTEIPGSANPIGPIKNPDSVGMPEVFSHAGSVAPSWDIARLERTLLQICDRADSITGKSKDRMALADLLRDMAHIVESAPAEINLSHPDLPGVSVNAQRGIMLIARIGKAFATAGKTRSTLFGKAARK